MEEIGRLLRFVRPYRCRSVAALGLLAAVVAVDLAIPRLIQRLIDQGIAPRDLHVVLSTTAVMLGISLLEALLAVGNNVLSVQVGEAVARDVRDALFVKIQSLSFGNLDRLSTGRLMVRLSSDTGAFQRLVQVFLRIGTRAPLLMVGSLVLMFHTDTRLATLMLPVLLVTAGVVVFFVLRMEPLFRLVQQRLDRLNTVLQEMLAGVRVVKAFVRADHEEVRFGSANQDYASQSVRVMEFMSTLSPSMRVLVNIGVVAVLWAGGLEAIGGGLTVGQIVAFVNYLQTTLGPLMIMVMLANVLAAGSASAERLNEVLEMVPEVQDGAHPVVLPAGPAPRVAFESVTFRYNGAGSDAVLQDVDLVVEPGQMVAILGSTGAGKSSLVNLVPRFYDVSAGRVLLNGVDIRRLRQADLLAQIGAVPQETVLFSGTVRDNIRYGQPDASDAEVEAAARAAQAHDFVTRLPQGYDTHVEERGVNLSGGQKQRLAIARALLLRPAILILDDSTSAVDVETETRIQAALRQHMQGRTSLVVAQRISTVLGADRIVVIDAGRIAAVGTHPELMQSSRIYQEIYASQLGDGVPGGARP